MTDPTTYDCFIEALKLALKSRGHGAQARLAEYLRKDRSSVNDLVHGRKNASQSLQSQIASFFGLRLEEMLSDGRTVIAERRALVQPHAKGVARADTLGVPQQINEEIRRSEELESFDIPPPEGNPVVSKYLKMSLDILTSGNIPYVKALEQNLEAFHRAVQSEKELAKLKADVDLLKERSSELDELKEQVHLLMHKNNQLVAKDSLGEGESGEADGSESSKKNLM